MKIKNDGRFFEVGANSRLGAYSNKYGMSSQGTILLFFFFLLSLFILNIPDARLRQTSKISPPSLVCTVVQNVLHLHFLWVGMLVNSIALGIHFCETSNIFNS